MSVTESLNSVPFLPDLSTTAPWDAPIPSVPDPSSISIPDADNLIAEFSLYESTITSPISSTDNLAALSPVTDAKEMSFYRKRPAPLPAAFFPGNNSMAMPCAKRAKMEQTLLVEPCTPCTPLAARQFSRSCTSSISGDSNMVEAGNISLTMDRSQYAVDFDVSKSMEASPSPSECTDVVGEEDVDRCVERNMQKGCDVNSMMVDICPPSKELSARRRAYRRAALNKARAKKEECLFPIHGGLSINSGNASSGKFEMIGKVEGAVGGAINCARSGNSDPVDKKAARAIRNREAAMKSRIEAKLKMRKLQDENKCLAMKVENLSRENESLTVQLRNVLQHTLGMAVEGQDVKQLFNMMSQLTANGAQC